MYKEPKLIFRSLAHQSPFLAQKQESDHLDLNPSPAMC